MQKPGRRGDLAFVSHEALLKLRMKNKRLLGLLSALALLVAVGATLRGRATQHESRMQRAPEAELRQTLVTQPNDAIALYYLGQARLKAGDFAQAQPLLEKALKADPQRQENWLALAALAESRGDIPRTREILEELQTRFPNNPDAPLRLASVALSQGFVQAAHKSARKAAALAPERADAWTLLGRTSLGISNFAEAKAALEKAHSLAPKDWTITLSLGDLALGQKEYTAAATHYREAATLGPEQPAAWLSLAHSLVRQKALSPEQQQEAKTALQKSATLASGVALHPFVEGKLRLQQRRWDEASQAFARAYALDTSNPEPLFEASQVALAQNKTAEAKALLARHRALSEARQQRQATLDGLSQARSPERKSELKQKLVGIYRTLGKLWEARQVLSELDQADPKTRRQITEIESSAVFQQQRLRTFTSSTLVAEGNAALAQGQLDQAQAHFRTLVERDPSSAVALQGLGLALHQQGKPNEAVAYLSRATQLDPRLVASQFYLGEIALRFNLPQEAITRLETATKLDPDNARVWYRYHHALGLIDSKVNEQVAAARRCVALDPKNVTYQLELGEVLVDAGKLDEAETALRKALKLAPESAEANARLGGFLAASRTGTDAWKESALYLAAAARKDPAHEYTRYSQGVLALKQGRFAESIVFLKPLAQKNTQFQDIWYQLSRAYAGAGKTTEAAAALQHSRIIQKDSIDFQAAQEKLADDGKNTEQRLRVARLCVRNGQPLKAMAHYKILLSQDPQNRVAKQEMAALESTLAGQGRSGELMAFQEMLSTGASAKVPKPEASPK